MLSRERLAKTFEFLVKIDSVSKKEGKIAKELEKILKSLGASVQYDNAGEKIGGETGNLIAWLDGSIDVPPLMLNAHMDTVEPGEGVKPVLKDGVFYSDGTTILGADDKSAIAIIIETLRVLKEDKIPCGPLEIVFTISEEIGLCGAKNLDYSMIKSKSGYTIDAMDTEAIVTRAPGADRFEIKIHGRDAHAGASPEQGINAILLASKAISTLKLGRIDHETTCNIGTIHGGNATNIVPNLVTITGEARSHDPEKLENLTGKILNAFKETINNAKKHPDDTLPHLEINLERDFSRTLVPEDHLVVLCAKKAAEKLGMPLSPKMTGGGSDANIFFEKGIITGVMGTGMKNMHSVRESVALDDMEKMVRLMVEIIKMHSQTIS